MLVRDASVADVTAAAIHLLSERGYDATSVDELADALGTSRSTFFRRFGTKEDIVFADHAFLLDRLGEVMANTEGDAFDAVNQACMTVIRYHISRPKASLERRALLRSNPSLRERELVMSHRYERVFRTHLSASLVEPAAQWVASAYAASAVAVHNDALREWFENGVDAPRRLQANLSDLAQVFRQHALSERQRSSRVMVAVYEPGVSIETVITKIREAAEH